jgi:hypothetical protein
MEPSSAGSPAPTAPPTGTVETLLPRLPPRLDDDVLARSPEACRVFVPCDQYLKQTITELLGLASALEDGETGHGLG